MSSNSSCLVTNQGGALPLTATCLEGFYCPNNSLENPPEICPPTPQCRLTRLQEYHNICDHAQGTYEPIVCQPGFYCPSGGKRQIPCPKGHFCPLGTVEPFKCFGLSSCAEGSEREIPLAGLLCSILLDIFLVIVVSWPFPFAWIRQLSRGKLRRGAGGNDSESGVISAGRREISFSESKYHVSQFFTSDGSHGTAAGIEVEFSGISMRPTRSGIETLCLQNGVIRAGSFVGVMGPSGSGKSTLVKVLTGRAQPTTGSVLINGDTCRAAELRDLLALVPQDDIILPDLTVQENILYSSRVRIGSSRKDSEIEQYVDHLIISLGLNKVRNRLIGEVGKRGLSGGERKRVNIALELAAVPGIIVLDEPTSCLDAMTALSVIELLKSLTKQGVIVICVIHQPRLEIFAALDDLLLLNHGRQVYFGSAAAAKQCFQDAGYTFPLNSNPTDTMMDIMSCHDNLHLTDYPRNKPALPKQNLRIVLQSVKKIRAPWYCQVLLAFMRGTKQQTRQYPSFVLEILTGAGCGILIGLSNYEFKGHLFQGLFHLPFQLLSSPVSYRLLTEQGMLLCLTIGCAAGPAGVKTFGEEKLVFLRESCSGYSEGAYFLGKALSTLIRIFLSALHFTSFYLILTTPIVSFPNQLIVNLLYFYCIYGAASMISAITSPKNGPLITMLTSVLFCALSGCAPRLASVKSWNLAWLWYICPAVWIAEANFNQYTDPLAYLYDIKPAAEVTGFITGRTGFDLGMLFVLGTVYHFIAFLLFKVFLHRHGR